MMLSELMDSLCSMFFCVHLNGKTSTFIISELQQYIRKSRSIESKNSSPQKTTSLNMIKPISMSLISCVKNIFLITSTIKRSSLIWIKRKNSGKQNPGKMIGFWLNWLIRRYFVLMRCQTFNNRWIFQINCEQIALKNVDRTQFHSN